MGIKIRPFLAYLAGLPKTLLFNFRYFSFWTAIRLPVLVSHHTHMKRMRGKVVLNGTIRMGLVKMGFGEIGIFDNRYDRSIWEVTGTVIFRGSAFIGVGTKLAISGEFIVGDGCGINAHSQIVCQRKIVIGQDCLISWDTLLMDTDYHRIYSCEGGLVNDDQPITIGDHVWICCRSTLLRGATVGRGSVVAAGTVLRKPFLGSNQVIGGHPVRILRENIQWAL